MNPLKPLALIAFSAALAGDAPRPVALGRDEVLAAHALEGKAFRADALVENRYSTLNVVQFQDKIKSHYHKKHDEMVVAIKTAGTLTINGIEHTLASGSVFFIPKGTAHSASCPPGEVCVAYSIFTPRWDARKPDRIWLEK
jgi:quercetin dioxygenase-like cupin family protein